MATTVANPDDSARPDPHGIAAFRLAFDAGAHQAAERHRLAALAETVAALSLLEGPEGDYAAEFAAEVNAR